MRELLSGGTGVVKTAKLAGVGVSAATLYRYLPAVRTANTLGDWLRDGFK